MAYVEWLRVGRCLKCTAWVLGILLLLTVVAEYTFLNVGSKSALSGIELHTSTGDVNAREILNGATTAYSTLPDGTKRTTIVNSAKGVRYTIDDHGYFGKHVEIFERLVKRPEKLIGFGPVGFQRVAVPGGSMVTIDTNRPQGFAYYAAIATFLALIVATVLGAPFARQNDGHLEIALTNPASRTTLGLGAIIADVTGIAVAWLMTVAALFIAHIVEYAPNYTYGPRDTEVIVLGFAGLLAWYGMLCAATASMRRAYGVVLGISWPVASLVAVLARTDFGDSPMAQLVHWLATPLSWIDPFNYLHFGPAFTVDGRAAGSLAVSLQSELPALLILALVYVALAIVQWRRVEA
ncbi:MAG: ABC transporter permease subunit [Candidatus Cybelea sp.]